MNKILINKLNKNIVNIIGSYLLPLRRKSNFWDLFICTYYIKTTLDDYAVLCKSHDLYYFKYVKNFDNYKIISEKGLWSIRVIK